MVLKCPRCKRVTVYDPNIEAPAQDDDHLCMSCIFDDEEHIVRGDQ